MNLADAERLAWSLMDSHGLLAHGWGFAFDRAKSRGGLCSHTRRTISLSRFVTPLHTEAEVRNTILHEIAHALVGCDHGHDATWRAKAREIGCDGERCYSGAQPSRQWIGRCPGCGGETHRHRRPSVGREVSCARCNPVEYDDRFRIVFTRASA